MRELFYRLLSFVASYLGPGFFSVVARGIAAGYFLLFPRRTRTSIRFYRALYPGRSGLFHLSCAWRQFQRFTNVFLDRHVLQAGGPVKYTFQGRRYLIDALEKRQGGILLMSHLGNWEIGARLLRRDMPRLQLMLFVGRRTSDQIERLQKEDLLASGARIAVVDQDGGSTFDLVEAAAFMRSGGMVSMAGDMLWQPDQRYIEVRFLGHWVRLPEAPFLLALVTKAPLYIFFATGQGRQAYHFCVLAPLSVTASHRSRREAAIRQAAQAYADRLETQLRTSPFEWNHFKPFLGPPAAPKKALN